MILNRFKKKSVLAKDDFFHFIEFPSESKNFRINFFVF